MAKRTKCIERESSFPVPFEGMEVPKEEGPFMTGCHTASGDAVALHVQTTYAYYCRLQKIFEQVRDRKAKWKGGSEFSPLMNLESTAKEILPKAVAFLDLTEKGWIEAEDADFIFSDFLNWLGREFDSYCVDVSLGHQVVA